MLGGNQAFYDLRDELHRRGMKIVLDGVFNHASRGNFYFNDILENGANSAYARLVYGLRLAAAPV